MFRYLLAKAFRKFQPSALKGCQIHPTSTVLSGSQMVNVNVDRYSYCGYNNYIVNCSIGAFCSIADNVFIGGAEHRVDYVSTSPLFEEGRNCLGRRFYAHEKSKSEQVTIGNDVWIGFGVKIKAGITVGDGAVIGMASVVTRDVPEYEIWAGNPARKIKKRFDDETINRLLKLCWWNLSESQIAELAPYFNNVHQLLDRVAVK